MPRRRNQCAEPSEEIERCHHAAGLLPLPRFANSVDDHALRHREPFEAERRSRAVADQPRTGSGIAGGDADAGVDAETSEIGSMRRTREGEAPRLVVRRRSGVVLLRVGKTVQRSDAERAAQAGFEGAPRAFRFVGIAIDVTEQAAPP